MISQDSQSVTISPGGRRDESATETYTRILLAKHIGYPLWRPEPVAIPPECKAEGIHIGDVGIVNEKGLFEFSFNIGLSADHPVNIASALPAWFVPFEDLAYHIVKIDNAFDHPDIRSTSVRAIRPQAEQARYELLPRAVGDQPC